MNRTYRRRSVLGAVGTVAIAGCSGRSEREDFWDDPPSFDDTGVERVTESSLPDRPDPFPVSLTDDHLDEFAARVETILSLIPEDLGPETLPNGEIRKQILDPRNEARETVDRMRTERHALAEASAAIEACALAAEAAGVWIHVSVNHSPADLPVSPTSVAAASRRLQESLPDVAADMEHGVVFYAPLEDWSSTGYDTEGAEQFELGRLPLRSGEAAFRLESADAAIGVAERLSDRYRSSLADHVPVAGAFEAALQELAKPTFDRVNTFYGGDVPEHIRSRDVDEYVSGDLPENHPGVDLLRNRTSAFFGNEWTWPIAWPEEELSEWARTRVETHPATTLRQTHATFAHLDAFDSIRDRLEAGDEFVPSDADDLEAARRSAIEAVSNLITSGEPLDEWTAWKLVPDLRDADSDVTHDETVRDYTDTYAEYVWIATLGREAKTATERVGRAFDA